MNNSTKTSENILIEEMTINTIRTLSMDAVQKANSGHPGTPMALAPLAYVLWKRFLKFNPKNPDWFDRDRFILSNGHASECFCIQYCSSPVMIYHSMILKISDSGEALHPVILSMEKLREWGKRRPARWVRV